MIRLVVRLGQGLASTVATTRALVQIPEPRTRPSGTFDLLITADLVISTPRGSR